MLMRNEGLTSERRQLAGLDALELAGRNRTRWATRAWSATWPKLAAVLVGLLGWQAVVWTGWKPTYVLPGPGPVFSVLGDRIADGTVIRAAALTLSRALTGFALAVVIGGPIGLVVSTSRRVRSAVGALITGLQTMPSIAWFPLAILLFKISEGAILFVVVMGAAPSVANGIIGGVEQVPPLLERVGVVLGARGLKRFRLVTLPSAMPQIVGGLKQGWAFAWRSLMAGELIGIIANKPSIGAQLQIARDLADSTGLLAMMIVILALGIGVDSVFGLIERSMLRRRGLALPGS